MFELCTSPESVDLGQQIVGLETVIERAQLDGQAVAPGLHAHLGYLYALRGDRDAAAAALRAEKAAYPESTVFIDGVLERMQGEPQ